MIPTASPIVSPFPYEVFHGNRLQRPDPMREHL